MATTKQTQARALHYLVMDVAADGSGALVPTAACGRPVRAGGDLTPDAGYVSCRRCRRYVATCEVARG